jgi:hypothetical protein
MSKKSGQPAPDWTPYKVVTAKLYKITGTTITGAAKVLLIAAKSPLDVIKTAEKEFFIHSITYLAIEQDYIWIPRGL